MTFLLLLPFGLPLFFWFRFAGFVLTPPETIALVLLAEADAGVGTLSGGIGFGAIRTPRP